MYLVGTGTTQRLRACSGGCPGGQDIVHKQDPLTGDIAVPGRERAAHVFAPLGPGKLSLLVGVALSFDRVRSYRQSELIAEHLAYQGCLIIAPLGEPTSMEGHRYDAIVSCQVLRQPIQLNGQLDYTWSEEVVSMIFIAPHETFRGAGVGEQRTSSMVGRAEHTTIETLCLLALLLLAG